jgi:parallel beta-helix repeat protein
LSDNIILSNTAKARIGSNGGGIYLINSANPTLSGNTIQGNWGNLGSGVSVSGSDNATLSANIIQGNRDVYGSCGGCSVHLSASANVALDNNVIAGNQAGSGVCVEESTVVLRHTTLARGVDCAGSGVHIWRNGSSVWLTNTILVSHAVGITVAAGNTVTLAATLWGTDTWANTNDWSGAGAINTGTHNYWGDPGFVDPDAGDYHIGPRSAARDVGLNTGVNSDIDGDLRPLGPGPDLGADEYWPPGGFKYIFLPLVLQKTP